MDSHSDDDSDDEDETKDSKPPSIRNRRTNHNNNVSKFKISSKKRSLYNDSDISGGVESSPPPDKKRLCSADASAKLFESSNDMPEHVPPSDASINNDNNLPHEQSALEVLPNDKHRILVANTRRKQDNRNILTAHSHLLKMQRALQHIQGKIDRAQAAFDSAKASIRMHSEEDANHLLLDPKHKEWSDRYLELKKRTLQNDGHKGGERAEEEEFRASPPYGWMDMQRELKRSGDLEHYKVVLLDRLHFDWGNTRTTGLKRNTGEKRCFAIDSSPTASKTHLGIEKCTASLRNDSTEVVEGADTAEDLQNSSCHPLQLSPSNSKDMPECTISLSEANAANAVAASNSNLTMVANNNVQHSTMAQQGDQMIIDEIIGAMNNTGNTQQLSTTFGLNNLFNSSLGAGNATTNQQNYLSVTPQQQLHDLLNNVLQGQVFQNNCMSYASPPPVQQHLNQQHPLNPIQQQSLLQLNQQQHSMIHQQLRSNANNGIDISIPLQQHALAPTMSQHSMVTQLPCSTNNRMDGSGPHQQQQASASILLLNKLQQPTGTTPQPHHYTGFNFTNASSAEPIIESQINTSQHQHAGATPEAYTSFFASLSSAQQPQQPFHSRNNAVIGPSSLLEARALRLGYPQTNNLLPLSASGNNADKYLLGEAPQNEK
mmetsp:Transcript_33822/g.81773  ORF Transcript_33822/g.81773 Transcript_33822/m.81773 type:complete len:658 (+) Transcript_33822:453-2426(+)